MITFKIKYNTAKENYWLIREYQRQYSICFKVAYKYKKQRLTDKEVKEKLKTYKNVELVANNSWFVASILYEIKMLPKNKIVCFNYLLQKLRSQNKINKEEFKQNKLLNICSMGDTLKHSNRFFRIQDNQTILFQPRNNTKILLNLQSVGKNRLKDLNKLLELQKQNLIPITYKLNNRYIYISFDEKYLQEVKQIKPILNRIFSIDLNPNYIGYSVVDWKNVESLNYHIVSSGVVSLKDINDKYFDLKGKGYSSASKERKYIANKRIFEVYEIAKQLVGLAKHYRCEIFAIEDLNIKSEDRQLGKKFNSLCNNLWQRNKLVSNLEKRLNLVGIKAQKVIANWSSVLGNTLYRQTDLPDMILSSIEISRRAQEFSIIYLKKQKEQTKTIIFPTLTEKVRSLVFQAMEALKINFEFENMKDFCLFLKKNLKNKYRVPLDLSRVFRQKHLKYQLIFFNRV